MLIESPVKAKNEVVPSIQAGADVLYAGFDSTIIFKEQLINNRRPWSNCNFDSLEELIKSAELVHEFDKKIYITFNELNYTLAQTEKILDFMVKNKDFDGFIICDLNLFLEIKKNKLDNYLVGGIGTNIFNAKTAAFYKKLNARELVLPRHLTISEISSIVSLDKDFNYQTIVKNDDCFNVDGLCTFSHGVFRSLACDEYYDINVLEGEYDQRIIKNLNEYKCYLRQDCQFCNLWEIARIGIKTAKLAGRGRPFNDILQDIFLLKRVINNLSLSKESFKQAVRNDIADIKHQQCKNNCIYMNG